MDLEFRSVSLNQLVELWLRPSYKRDLKNAAGWPPEGVKLLSVVPVSCSEKHVLAAPRFFHWFLRELMVYFLLELDNH